MASTTVTMNETRITVESSALTDMSQVSGKGCDASDAAGALELSPRHANVEELLDRCEQLGDIDEGDEEEAIQYGIGNEREVLFVHRDRMQGGGDVQQRQQDPPVCDVRRGARLQCREGEEQVAEDVEHRPDDRFEQH